MPLSVNAALSKDKTTGKGVSLQHRHFAFIASVIAEISDDSIRATTCLRFASACQLTNPNFNWDRFVRACNVARFEVEAAKKYED